MTRTFALFLLVLLVCSASTNAEAQWDLLWQHADGRRGVWTMDGTTRRSGELMFTDLLPDPLADPLWQIASSSGFAIVLQHQGDGRLEGWKQLGSSLAASDEWTDRTVVHEWLDQD